MPDVRYSLSSSSGNQKCENKPYTLKETLSLKKKRYNHLNRKEKKKCFAGEKIYTMSELQTCFFMLIYSLLYVRAVKIGGKTRRQVAKCIQRNLKNLFICIF